MASIRGKITLGYMALAFGVGGFVLFVSADLRFLEGRVRDGVAVSSFQETALEMRRHEKNYLLYRAAEDLADTRDLAAQLATRLDSDHAALASAASVADLAALRQSLRRYRELLDQARADAPAAQRAALREAGHAISGQSERLAERERDTLIETVRQSRYALLWSVGVVVVLALIGGQVIYRVVGRPLRRLEEQLEPLAQGRFQSFTMVSDDREIVSFTQALNHMLDELALRRRQLLQSDKLASLGTLASGVAHELNNPLGNISGASQILSEELDGLTMDVADRQPFLEWLKQIDDETERARRIVRTLLDYSRRQSSNAHTSGLAGIVDKSLLLLRPRLPSEDSVRCECAPELRVRVDPTRLQQVFINLIQNALDAGGEAVRIRITAQAMTGREWPPAGAGLVFGNSPEDRPGVRVSLSDDGPGIPTLHLEHIFEPFFTTRAPGEGTGLGLYIVGEIIQEQGGAIAVSTPAEGGTRFDLWLPDGEVQP